MSPDTTGSAVITDERRFYASNRIRWCFSALIPLILSPSEVPPSRMPHPQPHLLSQVELLRGLGSRLTLLDRPQGKALTSFRKGLHVPRLHLGSDSVGGIFSPPGSSGRFQTDLHIFKVDSKKLFEFKGFKRKEVWNFDKIKHFHSYFSGWLETYGHGLSPHINRWDILTK